MYSLKLLPLSPDICYCLLNRIKQILCSHNIFEILFLLQQVSVSAEGNIRCTVELTLVGQARCQVIPDPRPLGQQLLECLNITLPDAIPHRGITVATRKDLTARRK